MVSNQPTSVKPTIANSQLDKIIKTNCQLVDQLLTENTDLIEPTYLKWFAARFYKMNAETVRRAASEARADGKNPRRLFSFLINKGYSRY